jgi:DNA repair protein RadC
MPASALPAAVRGEFKKILTGGNPMQMQLSFFEHADATEEETRYVVREILRPYADEESLLANLFGKNGNRTARKLFQAFPGMQLVINAEPAALAQTIGAESAEKVLALIQLSQKINQRKLTHRVQHPEDIYDLMKSYASLDRERFWVITLDTKLQVLGIHEMYRGSINAITSFRIAELLRPAIVMNAASIVLVHNHPTDNLSPSPEDIATTRAVRQSAKAIDISISDHVIIGTSGFYSLREKYADVFQ